MWKVACNGEVEVGCCLLEDGTAGGWGVTPDNEGQWWEENFTEIILEKNAAATVESGQS